RLERRVGPVEVLLGQADRAGDVAHLPEIHGAGIQEERALLEAGPGLRGLDDLVAPLHQDAPAPGEAPGAPRRPSPASQDARGPDEEDAPRPETHAPDGSTAARGSLLRSAAKDATAMALLTTEALVLRAYDLGETSKIVVLLTRARGKVRAVAKGARGARPRYRSALEPLSEVSVSLYGRQGADLLRLGDCDLLRSAFRTGERGLEAVLFLSYAAELLDAFAQEGEAEERVYRLALASVRAAGDGGSTPALARYLEAWLLRLGGLYPPL